MKRLFAALLIGCCVAPTSVFAIRGRLPKIKGTPVQIANLPPHSPVYFRLPKKILYNGVSSPDDLRLSSEPAQLSDDLLQNVIVRRVSRSVAYPLLFQKNSCSSCGKVFIPRDMLASGKNIYRGMRLTLEDVKNLLIDGLQISKVRHFSHRIFTDLEPFWSLVYATLHSSYSGYEKIDEENKHTYLPVIVRIPYSKNLKAYGADRSYTGDPSVVTFTKDIPATVISDVWVLWEVNDKKDWFKVVLEEGELLFLPAYGETHDKSEL